MSSPPAMDQAQSSPLTSERPEVAVAVAAVFGHEYVELLQKHLNQLHGHRAHPNRTLHLDAVVVTLLLGFYTGVTTLRGLEDLSEQPKLSDQLPNERACRSTLADAMRSFDPHRLQPIVRDLLN